MVIFHCYVSSPHISHISSRDSIGVPLTCRGPIHACRVDKQGAQRRSDTMKRISQCLKQLKQRVNAYVFVWILFGSIYDMPTCHLQWQRRLAAHIFDASQWFPQHWQTCEALLTGHPHMCKSRLNRDIRDIYNLKCIRLCLLSQSDFKLIKMWI